MLAEMYVSKYMVNMCLCIYIYTYIPSLYIETWKYKLGYVTSESLQEKAQEQDFLNQSLQVY